MQIGYNNDVEYRDKTFHIQTEDHGVGPASIESQIFHAGAILDTSIISYSQVLEETDDVDERIARVRQLMQANHKKLYRKLFRGEYDEMVGLDPAGAPKDEVDVDEDFVPSQEAVPAAALEIERGNLDAIASLDTPGGEAVDLAALQAQLNADAAAMESEVDDAPTMMMTTADIHDTQQMRPIPAPTLKRNGAPRIDVPVTGVLAWRGVEKPREELEIVTLVEKYL